MLINTVPMYQDRDGLFTVENKITQLYIIKNFEPIPNTLNNTFLSAFLKLNNTYTFHNN